MTTQSSASIYSSLKASNPDDLFKGVLTPASERHRQDDMKFIQKCLNTSGVESWDDLTRAFNHAGVGEKLNEILKKKNLYVKEDISVDKAMELKIMMDCQGRVADSFGNPAVDELFMDGRVAPAWREKLVFSSPFDNHGNLQEAIIEFFPTDNRAALNECVHKFFDYAFQLICDEHGKLRTDAFKNYFVDEQGKELMSPLIEKFSEATVRDILIISVIQAMQAAFVSNEAKLYSSMVGAICNRQADILNKCRKEINQFRVKD